MIRRSCRTIIAFTLVLVGLVGGSRPSAHPGSTTTVVITATDPTSLDIVLHMDAVALATKLDAAASAPLEPEKRSADDLASRIRQCESYLLDQIALVIDDTRADARLMSVTVDAIGQASVRFTAARHEGAKRLTWSTGLVYGAYPVSVRAAGNVEVVRWLQGRETSASMSLGEPAHERLRAFGGGVWLGFTHILPLGLDHILFVVGLFLLNTRVRSLLVQVSAFTVAHSITLGLCLYGVVSLPPRLVEPLIALSVAYVGIENLFTSAVKPWRVAIVFAFGLLHGLGFADALASLTQSQTTLLSTLVAFNVGVELGQLAVIGCAAAFFRLLVVTQHASWRTPVARLASAGVGAMGLVWMIERVFF